MAERRGRINIIDEINVIDVVVTRCGGCQRACDSDSDPACRTTCIVCNAPTCRGCAAPVLTRQYVHMRCICPTSVRQEVTRVRRRFGSRALTGDEPSLAVLAAMDEMERIIVSEEATDDDRIAAFRAILAVSRSEGSLTAYYDPPGPSEDDCMATMQMEVDVNVTPRIATGGDLTSALIGLLGLESMIPMITGVDLSAAFDDVPKVSVEFIPNEEQLKRLQKALELLKSSEEITERAERTGRGINIQA